MGSTVIHSRAFECRHGDASIDWLVHVCALVEWENACEWQLRIAREANAATDRNSEQAQGM